MKNDNLVYVVAGDRMKELLNKKDSSLDIIPFREDLSKGSYEGFLFNEEFINNRSKLFNVSYELYYKNMEPIINIDLDKDYVLMFGEDDCCKANLNFLLNYLKNKGYKKTLTVRIVNEYNLSLIREYKVVM